MAYSKSHLTNLATLNLLSIFSEPSPSARLKAMQQAYSPSMVFHEPPSSDTVGNEAISDTITKLLNANPRWVFTPVGKAWIGSDGRMIKLAWEYGVKGQAGKVRGEDMILVGDDGRISELWVLLEGVSDVELES